MEKVVLHELGHNYGLPHCTSPYPCFMKAANGKISEVDEEPMDMCKVAGKLTYDNVKAVAGYLAAKPFVRASQTADAAKAGRGKELHEGPCKKCHQDGGSNPADDAGILAGQWMPYIQHTFEEFSSGNRPLPKKMKPQFDKLTKDDLDALVNYYGSFK